MAITRREFLIANACAKGSVPVKVPDFTRGKWKTRKPCFAQVDPFI